MRYVRISSVFKYQLGVYMQAMHEFSIVYMHAICGCQQYVMQAARVVLTQAVCVYRCKQCVCIDASSVCV